MQLWSWATIQKSECVTDATICYRTLWQVSVYPVVYAIRFMAKSRHFEITEVSTVSVCTIITSQDLSGSSIPQEDVPLLVTEHDSLRVMWISQAWPLMSFSLLLCWQDYIGFIFEHWMVHPHLSHGHVQGDPRVRDDQRHLLQVSSTLERGTS